MMTILISLFVVGWVAVALIGSLAYFMGERIPAYQKFGFKTPSF